MLIWRERGSSRAIESSVDTGIVTTSCCALSVMLTYWASTAATGATVCFAMGATVTGAEARLQGFCTCGATDATVVTYGDVDPQRKQCLCDGGCPIPQSGAAPCLQSPRTHPQDLSGSVDSFADRGLADVLITFGRFHGGSTVPLSRSHECSDWSIITAN